MKIIDNISLLLGDDLKDTLQPGSRLKVAASCFSMKTDFWAVWSGDGLDKDSEGNPVERTVDWQTIAADWQQMPVNHEPEDGSDT